MEAEAEALLSPSLCFDTTIPKWLRDHGFGDAMIESFVACWTAERDSRLTLRKCKIKSEGSFKNMVKSKNSALKNTKMDSTTLDSYNTLQDLKLMELSRSLINNLFSERK